MIQTVGNIWDFLPTHWICIPTNEGWNSRGENVMGRGLAQQAAKRFPELASIYGKFLVANPGAGETYPIVLNNAKLLMFPTKPLNKTAPAMSWKSNSSLALIDRASRFMRSWLTSLNNNDNVAIPALGCGLGGLQLYDVIDVLDENLTGETIGDRYLFVHAPIFPQ